MFLTESQGSTAAQAGGEESILEAIVAFNESFFEAFQESAIVQHEVLVQEAAGLLTEAEVADAKEKGKISKAAGKVWETISTFAARVWNAIKRGMDYLTAKFREWTKWYDKHKAEVAAVKSRDVVSVQQYVTPANAEKVLSLITKAAGSLEKASANFATRDTELSLTGILGFDSFADLMKDHTIESKGVRADELAAEGTKIWNTAVEVVKVASEMLKRVKELQNEAKGAIGKPNALNAAVFRRVLSLAAALANGALSTASSLRNKALTYMSKAVAADKKGADGDKKGSAKAESEGFDESMLESFKI